MKKRFSTTSIEELEQLVMPHRGIPASPVKGVFLRCQNWNGREGEGQGNSDGYHPGGPAQMAEAEHGTAHADGRGKFNLMGWPVVALGVSNECGGHGLTGSV